MKILQITAFICLFVAQSVCANPLEELSASSVILIEADTGNIVYEKNANQQLYPASTTKMMTAILAIENGRMDDAVAIGVEAAGTEGSSMNLAAGDRLILKDLLYGLMLVSGNDAATAIAMHVGGSAAAFVGHMNEKARELGATSTHFVNSSGLPDPKHYSTAHDLAKIARYAYRNPLFRDLTATPSLVVNWLAPEKQMRLENTNELLTNYSGATGIKTGYTESAGECLVASAERDGVTLIAAVMHAEDERRFAEAAKVLDYGFSRVKRHTAYPKEALSDTVFVRDGETHEVTAHPEADITYPLINSGDLEKFSVKIDRLPHVRAPVSKGQTIGWVRIFYEQTEVNKVALVADKEVKAGFSIIGMLITWYETMYEVLSGALFR